MSAVMPRRASAARYSGLARIVPIACAASCISSVGRTCAEISSHASITPAPTSTMASTTPHSGPGTMTARTRRSTRSPGFHCASTSLAGSCSTTLANSAPSGGDRCRKVRDCALHLLRREHLQRMRHLGLGHLVLGHRVLTTLIASAARPSGSPAACAIAPVQLRTIVSVASGSGSWLLWDSSASIFRSTAVVMST